jgi:hypothetical protein
MRWAGHIARMGGEGRCIQGFVVKTLGKETNLTAQAWVGG